MLLQEKLKDKKLVLASKSPRRQELLSGLDIPFETRLKEVDEIYPDGLLPHEVAVYLAKLKAAAFEPSEEEIVITSDTIVVLGDEIIGKPKDEADATKMVQKLSGGIHDVITAVCLRSPDKSVSFYDKTEVQFAHLTKEEIDYYIKKYQPFDKAGSYGVQEWVGYVAVTKMTGSYFTVMGFPVHRVYEELMKF